MYAVIFIYFLCLFSDMPCLCVPVLEMDGGMRMPETMAIARYLAREYGKFKV